MISMEHAIEHAAQAIRRTREFQAGAAFGVPEDAYEDYALGVARALAEAGLLAPAPLAGVKADAWDEGADAYQWNVHHATGPKDEITNPYRQEADR